MTFVDQWFHTRRGLLRTYFCLLAGSVVLSSASAYNQSVNSDVNVVLRIIPVDGRDLPLLEKRDFRITTNPSSLPFELLDLRSNQRNVRTSIPTYALVDLASCSNSPRVVEDFRNQAKLLFKYGWHLSVLTPDGEQTRFFKTIAEMDMQATTSSSRSISELAAIQQLTDFSGRHIVFKLCTQKDKVPESIANEATKALAILYAVYPKSSEEVVVQEQDHVVQTFNGSMDAVASSSVFAGGVSISRPISDEHPVAEPTLDKAGKDALLNERQYYDIRVPNAASLPQLNVTVQLGNRDSSKYRVETQAYSFAKTVPNLILSVR